MLTPRPAPPAPGTAAPARFNVLLPLATIVALAAAPAGAAELRGRVVGVTDGDTVTVLARDRSEYRVRLSAIDAPERRQPYGERARQRLAALVSGKDVTVLWHKRDRYGRLVGKVLAPDCGHAACADTLDAGLSLIAAGLAWHYKDYASEQSAADRASYAAAEASARNSHAGLWQDANPVPPWSYRRAGARSSALPPLLRAARDAPRMSALAGGFFPRAKSLRIESQALHVHLPQQGAIHVEPQWSRQAGSPRPGAGAARQSAPPSHLDQLR